MAVVLFPDKNSVLGRGPVLFVVATIMCLEAIAFANGVGAREVPREESEASEFTLADLYAEDATVRGRAALAVARRSARRVHPPARRRGEENVSQPDDVDNDPAPSADGDPIPALIGALEVESDSTAAFALVRALVALDDGRALPALLERSEFFGDDLLPLVPMARRSAASPALLAALTSTQRGDVRMFTTTMLREHVAAGAQLPLEPIRETYRRDKSSGETPKTPLIALYLEVGRRDALLEVVEDLEAGRLQEDEPAIAGHVARSAARLGLSDGATTLRHEVAERLVAIADGVEARAASLLAVAATWVDADAVPRNPISMSSSSAMSTEVLASAFVLARRSDSNNEERREAVEYLRRNLPVADHPVLYAWAPELLIAVLGRAAAATFVDSLDSRESYQAGVRGLELLGSAAADEVAARRSNLSPHALRAVADWERTVLLESLRRRAPGHPEEAPGAAR